MTSFQPRDPDYEAKVRTSFGLQTAMETLGASLASVAPGVVEIDMPYDAGLAQQPGLLHGGIVTAILDTACRCAAFTLSAPDTAVLTVEYKVNFISPAKGQRLSARGQVVRPGSTITVCKGDVVVHDGGQEKVVATMLSTMMVMPS